MEETRLPKRDEYLSLLEKVHVRFEEELLDGEREEAVKLLDYIKPDFGECWFLSVAIRNRDYEMLKLLLERKPKKGLLNPLVRAAREQDRKAAKLLIDYGVDIQPFEGTDVYRWLKEISQT